LKQTRNQTAFRLKMRIARSKSLSMPWTRVGVRLIPKGHSANRSLSAIEPVSATAKRKLENGEQRPVPELYPARAEIPKITGQRLGSASVIRGNVAGSHTPGNNTPETRLRTKSAEQILVHPIAGATTATTERITSKNAARGSVRPAALCRASP
jgi:hypothetical protein